MLNFIQYLPMAIATGYICGLMALQARGAR